MKERRVSIFNLLIDMLAGWRRLILLMIVFGVGFGGMSYVKAVQQARTQKEQMDQIKQGNVVTEQLEADEQFVKAQLTEDEISVVESVIADENLLNSYQEYRENSCYMNIDPFHVQQEKMVFYITADDLMKTYSIERVYENVVKSEDLLEAVAEICGMTQEDANELIQVIDLDTQQMLGTDTFAIYIIGSERSVCDDIADVIIDYLEQEKNELTKTVGNHELTLLKRSWTTYFDRDIEYRQRQIQDLIKQYETNTKSVIDTFSQNQKILYDILKGDAAKVKVQNPGISLKTIIIGIMLSVVIYAMGIFIKCITNNKLQKADDFSYMFSISEIVRITLPKKKRAFDFLDKWIEKLRVRNRRDFTMEELIEMGVGSIKTALDRMDEKCVCLVGCNFDSIGEKVGQDISERLIDKGVTVKLLKNVIYDAEGMSKFPEGVPVVLLETTDKVFYSEIEKEIELVTQERTEILGAIILEA